jgi:SAM-dependent methyltransferase
MRQEPPNASRLRLSVIGKLTRFSRSPVTRLLRTLRVDKLFPFVIDKYYAELAFQREWTPLFLKKKDKVLEYWKRFRYLNEIIQICKITDASSVLDVGCGISGVLNFLPGKRYGIDPLAEEYLKFYQYPADLNIRKGFGEAIPFPNETFDVVLSSHMLDHTTDPSMTLDEISRVLKPTGHFVLVVEIFPSQAERDLAHPHSLTRDDVYKLLSGRFENIFERTSPWMLVSSYVKGSTKLAGEQLIMVLTKSDKRH